MKKSLYFLTGIAPFHKHSGYTYANIACILCPFLIGIVESIGSNGLNFLAAIGVLGIL